MNEGPANRSSMVETTDCLEAIAVLRGWKRLFFTIVLICLLLTQAAFWLVDRGVVTDEGARPAASAEFARLRAPAPADAPAADAAPPAASTGPADWLKGLNTGHLARTVGLINGIAIVTAALYVLAMFFSFMVSLIGGVGGIRHISRAFFLSVILLVLMVPWQALLNSRLPGVVYTFPELRNWMAVKSDSTLNTVLFYLRFSGYWLFVTLLLLMAQLRSARWTKSIRRRLEII